MNKRVYNGEDYSFLKRKQCLALLVSPLFLKQEMRDLGRKSLKNQSVLKIKSLVTNSKSNIKETVSEFNEFEPRLKYAKNRFQLSAGLNFEKFNTILSGTNHILAVA